MRNICRDTDMSVKLLCPYLDLSLVFFAGETALFSPCRPSFGNNTHMGMKSLPVFLLFLCICGGGDRSQ